MTDNPSHLGNYVTADSLSESEEFTLLRIRLQPASRHVTDDALNQCLTGPFFGMS